MAALAGVYATAYRRLGGRGLGRGMLLVETVGARTGRRRTAAVASFPDGDDRWLVAATAGGSAHHPGWVINLARHPEDVHIQVGPRRIRVRPDVLCGAERAAAWQGIVARSPSFARYERATDREIPVVRLSTVV